MEGKKITTNGHWLSDWCTTCWSHLIISPTTRRGVAVSDWGTSSSVLIFSGFHHRPSQTQCHTPTPRRTCSILRLVEYQGSAYPLFFSQVIWGHRVPSSASCFWSDIMLCLISIISSLLPRVTFGKDRWLWLSSYFVWIWFSFWKG